MKTNILLENNNKISIIIPVYNIEEYIERCINSVLQQTYTNIEIIIVNDGSTDKTAFVLDELHKKDNRIRILHKANGGVTSARLKGIKEATGEWIGFVDGDDYIEEDMYERLLYNALNHQADISHCGYKMVFPNRVDYYYNSGKFVKQDKIRGLKDLLEGSYIEPGLCNKLFHKSLFQCILCDNRMPENIKINEDVLMNYWLFKSANCAVYEDFCPYHYIVRKGSAANSKLNINKLKDPISVTKLILDDCKNMHEVCKVVEKRLLNQLVNVVSMSSTDQKELIVPYQQTIRKELKSKCGSLVKNSKESFVFKVKVIWAAYMPSLYRLLHRIYAKITGVDKKYSMD